MNLTKHDVLHIHLVYRNRMNMSQSTPITPTHVAPNTIAPATDPPAPFPLSQFPDDILNVIASKLDPIDFGSFRQVCRKTRNVTHSGFKDLYTVNFDRNLEILDDISESDSKLIHFTFGCKFTLFHQYRLMILSDDETTNPERQLLEEDDGLVSRVISRNLNKILKTRGLTFQNCHLVNLPPNNASFVTLLNTDTENIDNIWGVKFVRIELCKIQNFQALSNCLSFDSKKIGITDISHMTSTRIMKLVDEPIREIVNHKNLTCLFLNDCKELINISDLPNLNTLSLAGCHNLTTISNMRKLLKVTIDSTNIASFSNCNSKMEVHIQNCDFHSFPDCNFATLVSVKNCHNLTNIFGLRNVESIKFDSCNLRDINLSPISNTRKLQFENMKLNFMNDNVVFNADSIIVNSSMIGQVFMKKAAYVKSLLLDQCWVPKFDTEMETVSLWMSNCSFVEYPLVFPQNLTRLTMKNVGYADEFVFDPEIPCMISSLLKLTELKLENCELYLTMLINLPSLEKFSFVSTTERSDSDPLMLGVEPALMEVNNQLSSDESDWTQTY
jgi:hypothetical protein